MWDDRAPLVLRRLKDYYLENFGALPSNTHGAESTIKDTNHCQIKGRGENLSSTFSTARSGMVETVNNEAHEYFKNQPTIPGSRTLMPGKYGARKRKKDGLDYVEKTHKMRVDGSLKSTAAINFIIKRNKRLEVKLATAEGKAKWTQLRADISESQNQFEMKRVAVKTEAWENNMSKNKNPNILQRRVGIVEMMPLLEGTVTYSLLLQARDTQQIQTELRFRGLPDDGGWKSCLIMRLKKAEEERGSVDKYNFLPLSPDVDFRFLMEGSGAEESDDGEEAW
jgi:hypothetical protein